MSIKNDVNKILLKKYPHLEISVVKYSEVQTDNESKRIDSEYFKQEYLENERIIKSRDYTKLFNVCYFIRNGDDCRDYEENGVKYIRTGDIKEYGLDLNNCATIRNDFISEIKLSIGDLLITRKGNYGKSQVINKKEILKSIISSEIFLIKLKNINPYYTDTFLKSKFGQSQFERNIHGVSNFSVTQEALLNFLIPMFSKEFQLEIEAMVKDSHKALENSKKLYKEAEKILYEALGLDAENPLESILSFREKNKVIHNHLKRYKRLNISIRTYKESYLKTGRLDAEYYQEKFRKNEILIKNFSHSKLSDLVNIQKSIEPGSEAYQDDGIEFIRVANLGKFELSKSYIYLDKIKFINELERLYPQKDMILLTKDGSIGIAYCVPENLNCITSAAILHLKIKDKNIILPQVLTLIINSIIGQLQAQRDSGGAIISHWTISEIENILIPLLDLKTQRKIEAKVKQSFELRDKSKELLENAKVKIENAIIDS
ncbi:restriction endonuclease subunit S [Brachyspira aalborgi]|uniref:restriction endonuclease subunit S n=1 Tax=Brachyspira aalborgi TaxID=29522 RepID=UPI0011C970C5|nr:restriction endonuclease subunit S [Brachyspira aalborgi]TXJ15449.1 restriction endonuclease subunit S [Brachyspira aalborgi]TXJ17914.1 restriction endonuclease subunit S [Brachyspira aalborgi]TXJ47979.1 restriction endonuclease subunit S [Brachyspira aalborgi]